MVIGELFRVFGLEFFLELIVQIIAHNVQADANNQKIYREKPDQDKPVNFFLVIFPETANYITQSGNNQPW